MTSPRGTADRAAGPRISVVVPVHDDRQSLGLCLAALARQDVPAHEVLVVTDGLSPEASLVARAAGATLLPAAADRAGAAARGYDAASGDVIARIDAGAMPPADWLREIRGAFAADPKLAAVTGRGVFAELSPARRLVASAGYHGVYFGALGIALGQVPLHGANFAMRREVWEAVRGRVHRGDPAVHDDIDLTMRLGRGRRVRFEPRLAVAVPSPQLSRVGPLAASVLRTLHTMRINADRLRETLIGRLVAAGLLVERLVERVLHLVPKPR